MILAFSVWDVIKVPFGYIMEWLYQLTSNYGVSLILFSLIVKLLMIYPSAKGKKSMMRMTRLNPQLKKLEAKYGDDKKAYQDATMALYRAEGVKPTGGCLWTMLPLLIIFPLYAVVRQPMTYLLHLNADEVAKILEILKAGGVAVGETGSRTAFYSQMIGASHIPEFADQIRAALPGISEAALRGVNFNFLGLDLSSIPSFKFWNLEAYDWAHLGLFLLPLISAGLQLIASLATQKLNNSIVTDEKGERDKSADAVNNTAKSMIWMAPVMSLWIGYIMPAALSIYWISQAVFSSVQEVIFTKMFRKGFDEEDAAKQEAALQRAIEEAEKERIRAQRRAENPDGITENTSKKKQRLQQREEAAAAPREYAAKQRAAQGLAPEEEDLPLSGIAERPFCKGRAYKPDRYGRNTLDAADEDELYD